MSEEQRKEPAGQNPSAENPAALPGPQPRKIKKDAAGIPAIVSSLRHVLSEAGLGRGMKALAHVNQKGGFDCPSCAWPDPDDERSGIAEYCENGAKAIAEEATTKKVTPEFFALHSQAGLATLTDYETGRTAPLAHPIHPPTHPTHFHP